MLKGWYRLCHRRFCWTKWIHHHLASGLTAPFRLTVEARSYRCSSKTEESKRTCMNFRAQNLFSSYVLYICSSLQSYTIDTDNFTASMFQITSHLAWWAPPLRTAFHGTSRMWAAQRTCCRFTFEGEKYERTTMENMVLTCLHVFSLQFFRSIQWGSYQFPEATVRGKNGNVIFANLAESDALEAEILKPARDKHFEVC